MLKAVAAGFVLSLVLTVTIIGLRHDLASSIETARVASKIMTSATLAACACALVVSIGQPGAPLRMHALLFLAPMVLVLLSVTLELIVVPQDQWAASLMGKHAVFCLLSIPLLSLGPLAILLMALRQGAPERPGLAGAVAGLAASAMAAAAYALHCPDDSPLFVITWYGAAITVVALIGAVAGRRLLRW